eukprot:COSAG02_NODE_19089_length_900_cov_6.426966_1_plen_156_part_10
MWSTWQVEVAALLHTPAELHAAPSTTDSVVGAGDAPASLMNTTDSTPILTVFNCSIGDDGACALPQTLGLPHAPTELYSAPFAVGIAGIVRIASDSPVCTMNTTGVTGLCSNYIGDNGVNTLDSTATATGAGGTSTGPRSGATTRLGQLVTLLSGN